MLPKDNRTEERKKADAAAAARAAARMETARGLYAKIQEQTEDVAVTSIALALLWAEAEGKLAAYETTAQFVGVAFQEIKRTSGNLAGGDIPEASLFQPDALDELKPDGPVLDDQALQQLADAEAPARVSDR